MTIRSRRRDRVLRALEWTFLFAGLAALDCYVWINTSTQLSQSYDDWAFDQTLRGVKPTVPGFLTAEVERLFSRNNSVPAPETPETIAPPRPAPPLPDALIGRLEIPRLKLKVMVREGAGEHTLRRAVGHIPGTSLPGGIGNVALAGHRDTFFRPLRAIRRDDVIDLQTAKQSYKYRVESTKIVSPRDVEVLKASGGETLTLVTCYPFYYVGSAPKRFIVKAIRVEKQEPLKSTQAALNPAQRKIKPAQAALNRPQPGS